MAPSPYRAGDLRPARPSTERADIISGTAFFFGCVAVLVSALTWGAVGSWPPAAAVATASACIGVILLATALTWARRAGYLARKREEWDNRYARPW